MVLHRFGLALDLDIARLGAADDLAQPAPALARGLVGPDEYAAQAEPAHPFHYDPVAYLHRMPLRVDGVVSPVAAGLEGDRDDLGRARSDRRRRGLLRSCWGHGCPPGMRAKTQERTPAGSTLRWSLARPACTWSLNSASRRAGSWPRGDCSGSASP